MNTAEMSLLFKHLWGLAIIYEGASKTISLTSTTVKELTWNLSRLVSKIFHGNLSKCISTFDQYFPCQTSIKLFPEKPCSYRAHYNALHAKLDWHRDFREIKRYQLVLMIHNNDRWVKMEEKTFDFIHVCCCRFSRAY